MKRKLVLSLFFMFLAFSLFSVPIQVIHQEGNPTGYTYGAGIFSGYYYEYNMDGGNGLFEPDGTGDDTPISNANGSGNVVYSIPGPPDILWLPLAVTFNDPPEVSLPEAFQGSFIYLKVYDAEDPFSALNYCYSIYPDPSDASFYIVPSSDPNILEAGVDFLWSEWFPIGGMPTTYNVSGTVTLGEDGLAGVNINYQVMEAPLRSGNNIKTNQIPSRNGRGDTTTDGDGDYDFDGLIDSDYEVTPSLEGYSFTPESRFVSNEEDDLTGIDFTATMNNTAPPAGGSGTNPGDPVVLDPEPIGVNGTLFDPAITVTPTGGDIITVNVTVSNTNSGAPVPENVDLSFTIDVTNSSGPVTLVLNHPFSIPPEPFIIIEDGLGGWIPIPSPQWETPGVGFVTFTYDFSGAGDSRDQLDIIMGGDNPLPVTLSSFMATPNIQDQSITLNWTAETETNMNGYCIWRSPSSDYLQAQNLTPGDLMIEAQNNSFTTTYTFTDDGTFSDDDLTPGTYHYWLQSNGYDGTTEYHGPISALLEESTIPELPTETVLRGNFPNPFNPTTVIKFDVKENETAKLIIYNLKGQIVLSETFEAQVDGYNYEWNADKLSSGVYFYKLQSNSYREIKKMLLLK